MSIFVIVGSSEPLYEIDLKKQREETAHLNLFVIHAAVDIVEELMWKSGNMSLKVVDKFNDQLVSAFVTATNMKFMLLHESRNEDGIKSFFNEVHQLYIKMLLNPFYEYDTPIRSSVFDTKVKALARRYL